MRFLCVAMVYLALTGCGHAKPKRTPVHAHQPPRAAAVVPLLKVTCGLLDPMLQISPALVTVAPIIAVPTVNNVALAAAERQYGTEVFFCAVGRAAALVSVAGGPQHQDIPDTVVLLRQHAVAVRTNSNILMKARGVVFVLPPPPKRPK